jgi:hypothetical protein
MSGFLLTMVNVLFSFSEERNVRLRTAVNFNDGEKIRFTKWGKTYENTY